MKNIITPVAITVLALSLISVPASDVETRVLQGVQRMMQENQGRVTFSDLHNDDRFSPEEKAFLARLYEIFFQIPGYLKREAERSGAIPTRAKMAQHFEISSTSIGLLLRVFELDGRVPPLFERDQTSGEVEALNRSNIDGFIRSRGDQIKISNWEGEAAPRFRLERLGGDELSSDQLRGKPALLYFWFTGCPPCVKIAPILAQLDRKYSAQGFQIVGLNADRILEIDASPQQVQEYLRKTDTRYPNLHLDESTRRAFGSVNVYPTLFFVNAEGTVVAHMLNFQTKEDLEKVIRQMLNP